MLSNILNGFSSEMEKIAVSAGWVLAPAEKALALSMKGQKIPHKKLVQAIRVCRMGDIKRAKELKQMKDIANKFSEKALSRNV